MIATWLVLGHRVNLDRYHRWFYFTPSVSYRWIGGYRIVDVSWLCWAVEIYITRNAS